MLEKIKLLGAKGPFGDNVFKNSVHTKQILKGGSYKAFDNLGAATWKDPSPIAEPLFLLLATLEKHPTRRSEVISALRFQRN